MEEIITTRSTTERNEEMWQEYVNGKKQNKLAEEYQMTQGRVSQILKKFKEQFKQEEPQQ